MRPLPLLLALASTTAAVLAQANCSAGPGSPTTFATQPFSGNSLYGHPNYPNAPGAGYTGFTFVFDMTLNVTVDITRIDIDLYDSGGAVNLGNGMQTTSPNQVGATTTVDFYIIPFATWIGSETSQASWTLLTTGTLTVGTPHADSPVVFTPPISLPAGFWGCAMVVNQTTSGPNPGPLHPMLDPLTTLPAPYSNPAMTITDLQFQRESWTATLAPATHRQNLEWHYTPLSDGATWTSFGTGCGAPNVPVLALNARPIIGTTVNFQTTNIAAGTSFSFLLIGFVANPNGLALGQFGLPGCNLYLQLGTAITTSISPVSNGAAGVPLSIPLNPSMSGLVLYGQAAPLTSGVNAGGLVASNAVCVALGLL